MMRAGTVLVAVLAWAAPAAAQGVWLQAGGGAGILEVGRATAIHPAGVLAVGYQSASALAVRAEARAVGNANYALLGPGLALGVAGATGPWTAAWALASGSMLLLTEGAWVTSLGVVGGGAVGRRAPLFTEARVELLQGELDRGGRGHLLVTLVAGVRVGALPPGSRRDP